MSTRRFRVTKQPDGSTDVTITRTDLGCLGGFATGVAVFFGIGAIVALFQAQWAAAGICLLLCGICLPNFAKRRRAAAVAADKPGPPKLERTGGLFGGLAAQGAAKGADVAPPPVSLADELMKLAALHDQGVLSDEEFSTIKERLLNQG